MEDFGALVLATFLSLFDLPTCLGLSFWSFMIP